MMVTTNPPGNMADDDQMALWITPMTQDAGVGDRDERPKNPTAVCRWC